ncbi:MAG: OsmC family protein [Gemmatimonadaceae bacterium]
MKGDEKIRDAVERNVKAVSLRPSLGQATAKTKVRLKPGLECEVEEGNWKLTVGMSEKSGGSNAGANPGTFGRGALGSCLAIGYGMWAARLGVPITSLEVEVEADYDSRGELGVADDVPPGYTQVRYIVTVESSASEEDIMRMLDTADKYSPYRDVFARAHDVRREVRVTALKH